MTLKMMHLPMCSDSNTAIFGGDLLHSSDQRIYLHATLVYYYPARMHEAVVSVFCK